MAATENSRATQDSLGASRGYPPKRGRLFPGEGPKSKNWIQRLARARKQGTGMMLSPGEVPDVCDFVYNTKEVLEIDEHGKVSNPKLARRIFGRPLRDPMAPTKPSNAGDEPPHEL